MSGSSGGFQRPFRPRKDLLNELLRRANAGVDSSVYTSKVNSFLQDILQEYNGRDVEAIRRHLETIKKALERDIEGTIDLLFGGSVKKHTFVDGLSDVDTLALIDDTSLEGKSPSEILGYFAKRLRQRLPHTEISIGKLAITIRFSDGHVIQILPTLRTKEGLRIATPQGDRWSNVVRPDAFAKKLTAVNRDCGGRVVPVVKLFKVLQSNLPNDAQLSGYHIESLAIEAFKGYTGNTNYKEMLIHMCDRAAELVKKPIMDRTGQSLYVDEYLGPSGSGARLRISAFLSRLATRMRVADQNYTIAVWEELFGNE
ncbi:MAG: CBASS oligonucleotide cyclase [Bacillota bacterium]